MEPERPQGKFEDGVQSGPLSTTGKERIRREPIKAHKEIKMIRVKSTLNKIALHKGIR